MSSYPPERLRGLKHLPRLPEGQRTEAVRVRGAADMVAWVLTLTPAQRGVVFAQAHAAHLGAAVPLPPEGVTPGADPDAMPSVLTVRLPLPDLLTLDLSRHARTLLLDLQGGAVLSLKGRTWKLTRPDGSVQTVRHDTVNNLLAAGLLKAGG